jgi:DNA integrity scanning protein DisA with diadenylate cyclase activity
MNNPETQATGTRNRTNSSKAKQNKNKTKTKTKRMSNVDLYLLCAKYAHSYIFQ